VCCPNLRDVFFHCEKAIVEIQYSHDLDKAGVLGFLNQILWDTRTDFFKTHKTWVFVGKLGQMASLFTQMLHMNDASILIPG
jgi:hypothetical protein